MSFETIKDIVNFNPSRPLSKGKEFPFIDMASLPINGRDVTEISHKVFNGGGAKFKNGDTLFARITPCLENGKTAKVENLPVGCIAHGSTEFIVLSAKSKDDEDFVYYLARLPDFRSYAISRMEGTSGRQRVSWQALAEFNLRLPEKCKRKKIGEILKLLDDKIHLNNQINQTLESIAQAIFRSWFIDFNPVRAKIAAKQTGQDSELAAMCAISGKNEAELEQMAKEDFAELQATAALFPDELVESELGEVPKGWFKTDLSILADLNVQSWTKKNCPEKVTYVDLSNTKWGVIQQTEEFIFENAPSRARRVLKIGDTIVGTVRPANGSYAFIQRENLTGSTGFAVLSPKHENYAEFIYIVATDKENIKRLAHLADGGAYPAVSYDTVLTTPCILPIETKDRDRILGLFHQNVNELYNLLAAKTRENEYLVDTRDSLLPKLLSGELDVSDLQGEGD
ncbi:restriction endonuclease subunit S [Acinetobacter sp. VNH17]|uniref:Restriction endonuclease subunit S n=1 Tax=Acinetobacter thutiue TaxID=2998078 RepID=A0ABT7WNK7_9GAMM|nr:restriction endonuclease subunit S [Acinetobacter thutiue]MCY6412060.1 restriction endonuclease subunit S [Acinetobacter thutiue]MDN0014164.1 restriction endonuclease subunit S [Acinetobacter thutiue]